MAPDKSFRSADQVGIVTAAKAAVRSKQDEIDLFFFACLQERMSFDGNPGGDVFQKLGHFFGIRARRHRGFLGATQLGSRNHLHGFGDLLRVADRADPFTYRFERGHNLLGLRHED